MVVVYGSPYEETKMEFIDKLHRVMDQWQGPTLVGGDFNLVRNQSEKSNGVINFNHANAFNNWIDCWGTIEIKYPSRSFSWSNNQSCPVMAVLDKVLIYIDWDAKFPLAMVWQYKIRLLRRKIKRVE
jgi:hypothetical protein